MESTLRHLEKDLAAIRAGRANPAVLDKVTVDYYGTPTPINQVAAVAVAEARVLTITPWDSSLVRAIEKREQEEGMTNLYFIRMDAEYIENVFAENEVANIYLNFSDPWPKDRHAKRRLTSTHFFEHYDHILAPDGRVMFKTDNRPLFDFSLEQVPEAGWTLDNYTYDLHHSEYNEGNIMTEYEAKFSALGTPINRLVAYRTKK